MCELTQIFIDVLADEFEVDVTKEDAKFRIDQMDFKDAVAELIRKEVEEKSQDCGNCGRSIPEWINHSCQENSRTIELKELMNEGGKGE